VSIIVQAWVYAHSEARLAERLVLLAIADEADDDGTHAFPSQRRIAEKARLAVNTARGAIERLEASGEILVKRPEKTGRGHHNEYVVLMGRDPIEVGVEVGWRTAGSEAVIEKGVNPEHLPPLGVEPLPPGTEYAVYPSGEIRTVPEERAGTRGNARPRVDTDPQTPTPSDQERARPRFLEYDALVEAFGEPGTKEEAGFYAKVARGLQRNGKAPVEIEERGKRARDRHPDCTVNILLTRWSNFAPRGPAPGSTLDDVAQRDLEARR